MARQPTPVELSAEDRRRLRDWINDAAESQLRAQRARIILLAAEQRSTLQIARALGVRPARVSKWRTRFAASGLAGLENVAKPGKPRQYDEAIDSRILSLVEEPPPPDTDVWTGPLLAQVLGDVSADYIWRVLRRNRIKLRRRDPSEVETRSFARPKVAALLALYLSSRASAFLIGTGDAATSAVAIPVRGFVRVESSEAAAHLRQNVRARTLSLPDALQWAVTLAERRLYTGRSPRTLDAFLSDARSWLPVGEIHAFVFGFTLLPHPDLQIFAPPTTAAFQGHLRSWLTILTTGTSPHNADLISKLVATAEEFVLAQSAGSQAAFEWHARISYTGFRERSAGDAA